MTQTSSPIHKSHFSPHTCTIVAATSTTLVIQCRCQCHNLQLHNHCAPLPQDLVLQVTVTYLVIILTEMNPPKCTSVTCTTSPVPTVGLSTWPTSLKTRVTCQTTPLTQWAMPYRTTLRKFSCIISYSLILVTF